MPPVTPIPLSGKERTISPEGVRAQMPFALGNSSVSGWTAIRAQTGFLDPWGFVGADLTIGRISSGLPATRQGPDHICSIGALGVHLYVRTE